MGNYVVSKNAATRLDDIYQYSLSKWGESQAEQYIKGIFQHFEDITQGKVWLRPIPAEFEVDGRVSRYEKHFVYSKVLNTGKVAIVTILHEKMHQIGRFSDDFK